MDISDSFDSQQDDQQLNGQQQTQPQQQQQQQMQCDPMFSQSSASALNGFVPGSFGTAVQMGPIQLPVQTAIPLPAPPSSFGVYKVPTTQPEMSTTGTDVDIDSLLLQQFSCLGTTDHEDLINQFQSLMNNQMNSDSARFFLEMSNWNLQTAVGCYLDFCNIQTLPSMKILEQSRPTELQYTWGLQNDGTDNWPRGCYLMSPNQAKRIEIPAIKPGDTCEILADIPPTHTETAFMWRLCTPNGWYFGETLWIIPPGTCNTQAELVERMSQPKTSAENWPQINVVISMKME